MQSERHRGFLNADNRLPTTKGAQALTDAISIRRLALAHKIPFFTLLTSARAGVQAMRAMKSRDMNVKPIQDYFCDSAEQEAAE